MDASSKFKGMLPTTPEKLMDIIISLDVNFSKHTHIPLRTVQDARANRGDMIGTHIKNLYLRDRKKRNFLLVVEENRLIDLKVLERQISSTRLSFGSAERLIEMLGVCPGAVSPFSLVNDPDHKVQLVLDKELASQKTVYAHPLVNDMTLGITGEDLMKFFKFTGHQPLVLEFK